MAISPNPTGMTYVYAPQVKTAYGRTDMDVPMPDTTYAFKLKINGTAQEALHQIDSRDYVLPSASLTSRTVLKVE